MLFERTKDKRNRIPINKRAFRKNMVFDVIVGLINNESLIPGRIKRTSSITMNTEKWALSGAFFSRNNNLLRFKRNFGLYL